MNLEYIWECMKVQLIGELGWWVVEILAIFLLLSVATIFFIKTTEGKGKEDEK